MKYPSLFLLFTIILISCDNPQRTRFQDTTTFTQGYNDNPNASVYSDDEENGEDDPITTGGGSQEPGFETCDLGMENYGGTIGYFGLCQSTQDERKFKTVFAQSDLTVGTCFVPIHIEQNGNSFNLGIAECVHNQANTTYFMTLYKQRSEAINGVMVIKASSLNSYMQCMSAYTDYINSHPNCAYSQTCLQYAQQYAYNVCTLFVQNHSANYKQWPN